MELTKLERELIEELRGQVASFDEKDHLLVSWSVVGGKTTKTGVRVVSAAGVTDADFGVGGEEGVHLTRGMLTQMVFQLRQATDFVTGVAEPLGGLLGEPEGGRPPGYDVDDAAGKALAERIMDGEAVH